VRQEATAEGDYPVAYAWDNDRTAFVECPETGLDDRLGIRKRAVNRCVTNIDTKRVDEPCARGTGA